MKSFISNVAWTGLAITLLSALGTGASLAADKQVSIGYQLMLNPWKVAIENGTFEEATGYDIEWVRFTAGGDAARGLAAGAVQITVIGSTGITTAVSNGVPAKLFWIMEGIAENERLVVREEIKGPEDLGGKTLAVPLGSTSQLDLFYALKKWGVDANVIYMSPPSIVAAWKRGDIDGAFVWPPALFELEETGHSITTSGVVCEEQQICTYDGMLVKTDWAQTHPEFMWKFVQTLNDVNARYVNNPEAWTADSEMVQTIAQVSGADPEAVPKALKNYDFPLIEEQLSEQWLGGGAVNSLAVTAEWLQKLGTLSNVLPDYDVAVTTKWIEMAMSKPDTYTPTGQDNSKQDSGTQ